MELKKKLSTKQTLERDRFIVDHLVTCRVIALHIQRSLPAHVELDDLIQAGVLGLIDAADKYNPNKQINFSVYAKHRIRGAILDSLRKLDFASRDLRRQWKAVAVATRELCTILRRDPSEEEIAAHLCIDIAHLRKLKFDAYSVGHISISYRDTAGDGVVEREFRGRPETRPDNMFSKVQMRVTLDKAMKPLRPRQQEVLRGYYFAHRTMKEIAALLGVNESRVSQLHKSALAGMQAELLAQGVHSSGAF